jgi:NAD+ kinase
MKIKRIGIIANAEKKAAAVYTTQLKQWAEQRGLAVHLEAQAALKMGGKGGLEGAEFASCIDIAVVFGGDGTLIKAARSLREHDVPILGINLGSFGYLTVFNLNELYEAMEMILREDYRIEKRMMLDAVVTRNGETVSENTVLNDAVINQGNPFRLVALETFVDDSYLTTFRADGLIVSTPTGSTAYSLSAGGPIIFPQLNSIIINPICPHTLTNRPIILPEGATIRISSSTETGRATLTYDGQPFFLMNKGDVVTVKKSRYSTQLIVSPQRDYLEILRSKLGWGGRPSGISNG